MSEQTEIQFVEGMIAKKPSEKAPWVKVKLAIKKAEFVEFLAKTDMNNLWMNIDVCESKAGKWYAKVDTWKPEKQEGQYTQTEEQKAFDDIKPSDIHGSVEAPSGSEILSDSITF